MKPCNQLDILYTRDLYPDQGETGNTFWGLHVANNLTRLMMITGTAYFPGHSNSWNPPGSFAYFPVEQYRFKSAPVCQLWSVEDMFTQSTVYAIGTVTRGTNINAYDTINHLIYNSVKANGGETVEPADVGDYLRIGQDEEIMRILLSFNLGYRILSSGEWLWTHSYRVVRGAVSSAMNHSANQQIYVVGHSGTQGIGLAGPGPSWNTGYGGNSFGISIVANGSSIYYHPSHVEAFVENNKFTVHWMSQRPGTVIFRLFGA